MLVLLFLLWSKWSNALALHLTWCIQNYTFVNKLIHFVLQAGKQIGHANLLLPLQLVALWPAAQFSFVLLELFHCFFSPGSPLITAAWFSFVLMELFHCFFSPVSRSSLQLNSPLFYCNYFTRRVCDPCEGRQPTALAEGGRGRGGSRVNLSRSWDHSATTCHFHHVMYLRYLTLQLKYT